MMIPSVPEFEYYFTSLGIAPVTGIYARYYCDSNYDARRASDPVFCLVARARDFDVACEVAESAAPEHIAADILGWPVGDVAALILGWNFGPSRRDQPEALECLASFWRGVQLFDEIKPASYAKINKARHYEFSGSSPAGTSFDVRRNRGH